MTRSFLPLALVSILATGCAHATLAPATTADKATEVAKAPKDKAASDDADARKDEAASKDDAKSDQAKGDEAIVPAKAEGDLRAVETRGRAPGDFIVYRFSGSFRKTPLTLSEKVIDKKGSVLTIDLSADDDGKKTELRLFIDEAGGKNEVLRVSRLAGGVEKAATIDTYEQLMATTVLAADENEALLGKEELTLDLGGAPLPCQTTSYRVRVGKKHATLRTLESEGFAWGDVGGDITTAAGKTLYRAEIIELGHTDLTKGSAVADATR
ncbi:MAG: hypothetical protein ABI193_11620 [Minicystis sp.]